MGRRPGGDTPTCVIALDGGKLTPVDDPVHHARALLRSHATSAGPLRSAGRVRAMLAVRLNQLAAGGTATADRDLTADIDRATGLIDALANLT